jgi:hypothetical protein
LEGWLSTKGTESGLVRSWAEGSDMKIFAVQRSEELRLALTGASRSLTLSDYFYEINRLAPNTTRHARGKPWSKTTSRRNAIPPLGK